MRNYGCEKSFWILKRGGEISSKRKRSRACRPLKGRKGAKRDPVFACKNETLQNSREPGVREKGGGPGKGNRSHCNLAKQKKKRQRFASSRKEECLPRRHSSGHE